MPGFPEYVEWSRKKGVCPSALEELELLKRLGEGAFSEVWQVRERATGHIFALKVVNKQRMAAQQFQRDVFMERLVLQEVRTPVIPKMYRLFQDNIHLYFKIQWAEGGSLAKYLHKHGATLSTSQKRQLVRQLVEGLEQLHSQGVVHGDLKPENVLRTAEGQLLLADFGSSRVLDLPGTSPILLEEFNSIEVKHPVALMSASGEDPIDKFIRLGSLQGTINYLSPELLEGQRNSFASDMWALGAVVHQIFTGILLFEGSDDIAVVQAIENDHRNSDWSLAAPLRAFIDQLTTRDPNQRLGNRYQTIKDNYRDILNHAFFTSSFLADHDKCPVDLSKTGDLELRPSSVSLRNLANGGTIVTKATLARWRFWTEEVLLIITNQTLKVVREASGKLIQQFPVDKLLTVSHNNGQFISVAHQSNQFCCKLRQETAPDWIRRVSTALIHASQ
jgi:serine/threonine protein kinase